MSNVNYERPAPIRDEAKTTEKLLLLLAVDGGSNFTKSLSLTANLSIRQVNRLLRKSGRATVTRTRDSGYNDYWCKLTSIPKITMAWE
jgi:hypothetical protein